MAASGTNEPCRLRRPMSAVGTLSGPNADVAFGPFMTQSGLPASDIIFDKPSLKFDMGAMVDAALGVSGFGYASRQMPLR
jgi:hypothetical protein